MIRGRLVEGQGIAHSFVRRYTDDLASVLKFEPFPGTLNVECPTVPIFPKTGIKINPQYGGEVTCYPCMIEANKIKLRGAIIIPEKTAHPAHVVEVIAKENLREKLQIRPGDEVRCTLSE